MTTLRFMRLIGSGLFGVAYSALLQVDGVNGQCEQWDSTSGVLAIRAPKNNLGYELGIYGAAGVNKEGFVHDFTYSPRGYWIGRGCADSPAYASPYSRLTFGQIPQGSASLKVHGWNGTMGAGTVLELWGM